MPALAKPLQIFRAGTQTDASGRTLAFTAADLAATAAAYDPAKHEAPLVVGHPATNAPAYGWAEALTQADGALEATPHQVDAAFAEMVNSGRFKKISSSFWLPDAPGNPVPGVYYLRHIGFLGAAAPALSSAFTLQSAKALPFWLVRACGSACRLPVIKARIMAAVPAGPASNTALPLAFSRGLGPAGQRRRLAVSPPRP